MSATMTREARLDVFNHEGDRGPFLVMVVTPYEQPVACYICDFWAQGFYCDAQIAPDFADLQFVDGYDAANALWCEIAKCCRQCEAMMAIQATPERAEAVYRPQFAIGIVCRDEADQQRIFRRAGRFARGRDVKVLVI